MMGITCCIKNCKSTWEKDCKINFYRFPLQNEAMMKYWIAATGYNNWFPHSDARICSLHFKDTDYSNNTEHTKLRCLKPNVIPTLHVHANILQVFKQNTNTFPIFQQNNKIHTIKKCAQNNIIIFKGDKSINKGDIMPKDLIAAIKRIVNNIKNDILEKVFMNFHKRTEFCTNSNDDQSNTVVQNQGNLIVKNNNEIASANGCVKCSKCAKYDALLEENQQLRKRIDEFNKSQEERLNQQASMFCELMNTKEAMLKEKLKVIREKNRALNRNIQRQREKNMYLKTLVTHFHRQQFSRRK